MSIGTSRQALGQPTAALRAQKLPPPPPVSAPILQGKDHQRQAFRSHGVEKESHSQWSNWFVG